MKLIILILMLIGSGCCARERHLIWPHVEAIEGEPGWFRAVSFEMPGAAESPGFSIRLPDGRVLKSSELSAWEGEKVLTYDTGFVLFARRDGAVRRVDVEIPHWMKAGIDEPAIGNASASVFYPLPISQRELVELFGPPERVDTYAKGLVTSSTVPDRRVP